VKRSGRKAIQRDVTWKEAEAFSGLLAAQIPMAIFSGTGKLLRVNAPAERELGISGPGWVGRTLTASGFRVLNENERLVPAGQCPWVRAARTHARITNVVVGLEHPDGLLQWFQITCAPMGKAPVSEVAVFLDNITERVHFEKRLAAQLHYEDALTSCVNQALCASSFCRNCTAMKHLLELPVAEISGVSTVHVFENTHDAEVGYCARLTGAMEREKGVVPVPTPVKVSWEKPHDEWAQSLEAGKAILESPQAENPLLAHLCKQLKLSSAAIFPLLSGGSWLGMIVFGRRKRGPAWSKQDLHLLRLTARMAGGMLGRKLVQERMLQAQKMETVGALASGLAHDFNNVLTGISSSLQVVMLDPDAQGRIGEELQSIQREIGRAADLSRRLLSFSQPTKGQPVAMNLNEQLELLARLFRRTLPKNIRIEMALSPEPIHGRMDPLQFEQALLNLVLNARDAMPQGGVLRISTFQCTWDHQHHGPVPRARPGTYACVSVADQGVGIAASALNKIFEPFYTTKKPGRGTGLGLSMVQAIVQQHHGYVHATSRPGVETVFTIAFPIAMPGDQVLPEAPKTLQVGGGVEVILLVDDEQAVLRSTSALLKRYGYQVLCAASGAEALETIRAQKNRVSLVIMDVSMPGMDGRECLKRVLELMPQMRVIMMSGYGLSALDWDPRHSGAAAFLDKPFDINIFLDVIRQQLDASPPLRAPFPVPLPESTIPTGS
jgi:signal transduction histidine kinase/CheY-like chemotaxis protein